MSRRRVSPVLVGRDGVLAEIASELDLAAAGGAGIILLGGPAGIGKSRLAEAVATLATGRGFRTLSGRCTPMASGALPYAPFAGALRGLALDLDPGVLDEVVAGDAPLLARITPSLDGAGDPGRHRVSPPHGLPRTRLLEALLGLLLRLAARDPILLVIEDLQWADPESLDALSYLARSFGEARVAVLLTFRSDEQQAVSHLSAWLAEVERLAWVDRVELAGLTLEHTGQLVRAILGTESDPAFIEAIHERSGGNPFFVEELLEAETGPETGASMAESLRAVLGDRVRSMPPDAWSVMGPLAVARREVDDDLLGAIVSLDEPRLQAALRCGLDHGLLAVEHRGSGDAWRFRHSLIAEVVYEQLLGPERRRLHRGMAEALEHRAGRQGATGAGGWAEIADHWRAALDDERELPALVRAAEDAERSFSFRAAFDAYRRAIAAWDRVADPCSLTGRDRLGLLRRAAWAAFLAAAPDADVPLRRAAVEEADRTGDPGESAVARADLGFALWAVGDPRGAESAYREALSELTVDVPSAARAHVLAVLGQVLLNTGRHRQALELCEGAIKVAREVGDRVVETNALNSSGVSLAYLGRGREGRTSLEVARGMALDLRDAEEAGRVYLNETEVLLLCGEPRRALALAGEGIETCRQMGTPVSCGQFIALHGSLAAFHLGDWQASEHLAREGSVALLAPSEELYYHCHVVELTVARGSWEEADGHLGRIAELLSAYPVELQYTGPYASALAELALWRRDPDAALRAVDLGLERLEETDGDIHRIGLLRIAVRASADLADTARALRDGDRAQRQLAMARVLRERLAPSVDAAQAWDGGVELVAAADMATVRAEEARLAGSPDPGLWQASADAWARLERPYHVGYAGWREGEAWLVHRDRAAAAAALRAAAATATTLGANPLLQEIGALARRSRLSLRDDRAETRRSPRKRGTSGEDAVQGGSTAFDLTGRELDVLALVSEGLTDRQIAAVLFISPHTVGIHVSRILGKLGATSRTEAAVMAYRLGLAGRADGPGATQATHHPLVLAGGRKPSSAK